MKKGLVSADQSSIGSLILTVRGLKVLLDADLAALYGVSTSRLNEAVKRNRSRFPADFVFRLMPQEHEILMSQIAISSSQHGGRRKLPNVFTEHGAIMAANVLRSARAIQMSVFVVRAFIRMRSFLADTRELAHRLAAIEKELKERLDVHESAFVGILQRLMDLIDPPALPEGPHESIGFRVREAAGRYTLTKHGRKRM